VSDFLQAEGVNWDEVGNVEELRVELYKQKQSEIANESKNPETITKII
jgi:hypothetical protein